MIEMKVDDCVKAIGGETLMGAGEKYFHGVSIDSRTLKKDELFFWADWLGTRAPPAPRW